MNHKFFCAVFLGLVAAAVVLPTPGLTQIPIPTGAPTDVAANPALNALGGGVPLPVSAPNGPLPVTVPGGLVPPPTWVDPNPPLLDQTICGKISGQDPRPPTCPAASAGPSAPPPNPHNDPVWQLPVEPAQDPEFNRVNQARLYPTGVPSTPQPPPTVGPSK